jgi:hypothetical protein
MKISYNFISLIAVGNFNPAIATLDFLTKVCELDLGELIKESPPDIPIHKALRFKNLSLIVDLDRLVIKQAEIEDISRAKVLGIFNVYYDKLPRTPLKAVGVNINCNLTFETDTEANSFEEKVKNPLASLDFFRANAVDVNENSRRTESETIWKGTTYRIENLNGLNWQISASRTKDLFDVNFNYEVDNLLQEPSKKLELLSKEYNRFCGKFLSFLKYMED